MSISVTTSCVGSAKTAAACCCISNRAFQQLRSSAGEDFSHLRLWIPVEGLRLKRIDHRGSVLSQQLSCSANTLHKNLRRHSRGLRFTRWCSQSRPRADSEREDRPSRPEVNGRAALSKLDDQLRSLSSTSNAGSREISTEPGIGKELAEKGNGNVEWPTFSDGIVVYFGVGLILLTIANNILFRLFVGPPVPPKNPPAPKAPEKRYRLRTYTDLEKLSSPH